MWALWLVLALVVAGVAVLLLRAGRSALDEPDETPCIEPAPGRCVVRSVRDGVVLYSGSDAVQAKREWHAERSHAELWVDGVLRGRVGGRGR